MALQRLSLVFNRVSLDRFFPGLHRNGQFFDFGDSRTQLLRSLWVIADGGVAPVLHRC